MGEFLKTTVSFSITVKDGNAALHFYSEAFGATETFRMPLPNGGLAHAEFLIGDTRIFLSEEYPDWKAFATPEGQFTPCLLNIEVDDCDAAHAKALKAGAEEISPPKDEFWGIRSSIIADPFGFRWSFGQLIEEISLEEVAKRAHELFGG